MTAYDQFNEIRNRLVDLLDNLDSTEIESLLGDLEDDTGDTALFFDLAEIAENYLWI